MTDADHVAPEVVLDRAGHRRSDAAWLADAWSRAKIIVVDASSLYTGHALVGADGDLVFVDAEHPAAAATAPADRFFLGVDASDVPYFAAIGHLPDVPEARAVTLREVGHALDPQSASVLATAVALVNWHARHRFSAMTGAETTVGDGGWTRVDTTGSQQWPRTDPAVIMLVHDGVAGESRSVPARPQRRLGSASRAGPPLLVPGRLRRARRVGRGRGRARGLGRGGGAGDRRALRREPAVALPRVADVGFLRPGRPDRAAAARPRGDRGGELVHPGRDPQSAGVDGLGRLRQRWSPACRWHRRSPTD